MRQYCTNSGWTSQHPGCCQAIRSSTRAPVTIADATATAASWTTERRNVNPFARPSTHHLWPIEEVLARPFFDVSPLRSTLSALIFSKTMWMHLECFRRWTLTVLSKVAHPTSQWDWDCSTSSRSRSTGSAAFDIVDSTVLEWCAV